jgi:hypothetical protein
MVMMCSPRSSGIVKRRATTGARCFSSTGLLVALVSSGHAQSIAPQRQAQFGISGAAEYDSNVLRLSDQDPSQSRSDLHLSETISLNWQRPIGQQDIYLVGVVSQNHYPHHPKLNNTSTSVQTGADWRAGVGCVARTGVAYARQRVNLADITSSALASSTQASRAMILSLSCARGPLLRPMVGYRTETVANSASALTQNDTETQTYDVSLGVQRPRFGELTLYGNIRRTRYPHHILNSPEYVRFTDAGLRWTRALGRHLTGTATLNYSNVVPESNATRPYAGLGWTANVALSPGGTRSHITLALSRATQQSTLINISYSIDSSSQIGIDYALTSRIKLLASLTISKRSFVGTAGSLGSALGLGDRSNGIAVGMRYALPFKLLAAPVSLACDASYSRRTADNPAFNYHDALASMSVRIGA